MSVFAGPEIINDGLVLSLDAANSRSYPGTGTTWTDLSGLRNTGTLTNGPTFSTTNNGSIVFDGTDDFISCGNASNIQITVGTIGAWIRANNGNSGYNGIIAKQFAWGLFVGDNLLVTFDWGNNVQRSTGITVGNSTWNFVAMTFTETIGTPTNNAIIYLNGVARLTTTVRHSNQNVNLEIGRAGPVGQHFGGDIAAAFVYNRVLSAAEISQNFNAIRGRFGI